MSYCLLANQFYRHLFILLNFNFVLFALALPMFVSVWRHIIAHSTVQFLPIFSPLTLWSFCSTQFVHFIWHFKCLLEQHTSSWTNDKFYGQLCVRHEGNELKLNVTIRVIVLWQNPLHFHSHKSENNGIAMVHKMYLYCSHHNFRLVMCVWWMKHAEKRS